MQAPITTHILYLHTGKPAVGINVSLRGPLQTSPIANGQTDVDGRIVQWDKEFQISAGTWHLLFATDAWFKAQGQTSFYADINLAFTVSDTNQHYHVPLLLNAFGYSTYRGS